VRVGIIASGLCYIWSTMGMGSGTDHCL
jgi:hypothetical protein